MATLPPEPGIRRVAVYVETTDGEKLLYDFQEVRDGVTISTDRDPEPWYYQNPVLSRPRFVRTDITFELLNVGNYTLYRPHPGQNPFAPQREAIEPLNSEIED